MLRWITKYSFKQDLEGRNEAASIFVFLTQKLRELGQTCGAEKVVGYPISQSHVLSLVLKLGESGWAQRSYSLGYMSKKLQNRQPGGKHGPPIQAPSSLWLIFCWSPYCSFDLKMSRPSNQLKDVLIMLHFMLGLRFRISSPFFPGYS